MRSRAWCFTLNNYTADEERIVHEVDCTYMVCGREVGELGTPHLQGYIYFKNARTENSVKNLLRRAHWEIARSDAETNATYCKKQGNYFESGLQPMSQKRKGEVSQERWANAWKAAKKGDIDAIDYDIRFRSYATIKAISKDYMPRPDDLTELDNHWVYGPPGTGKSRSVRLLYPESYIKSFNKWWDGYQHETNVILDDFPMRNADKLEQLMKIWTANQSFIAECKGGAMHIRPKRIIITSNYSLEDCFGYDQVALTAMKRRFKVTHIPFPIDFTSTVIEPVDQPSVIVPEDTPDDVQSELDFSVWDDTVFDTIEV